MEWPDEGQRQILISLVKGEEHGQRPLDRSSVAPPKDYFGLLVTDWSHSWEPVIASGWVTESSSGVALTPAGTELAQKLAAAFPSDYYWYEWYYSAAPVSQAYGEFCERLFGLNGSQHGFSDMVQVDRLIAEARIGPGEQVLDLGCGTGHIAQYIAGRTGSYVTGIDFSPRAIERAQSRTLGDPHLVFRVQDMTRLELAPASVDVVVAIDALYFTAVDSTVSQIAGLLRPSGRLATYYSHGWEPFKPVESFDPSTLPPGRTPLAIALGLAGFQWQSWDLTAEDWAHAQLKRELMEELRTRLEEEGNLSLYKNRHGEATGVAKAIAAGLHRRYLYVAQKDGALSEAER